MRASMGARRLLLLLLAACVCASRAQNTANNNSSSSSSVGGGNKMPHRSVWDDPIRFSTKTKDACTMVVSGAGDYTRLRVSCKGPSQGQGQAPAPGHSYYCDFQGKPNLCPAYNQNPRHYFTQMMWDMRKLSHACQGPKMYRPHMCKKHPDEVQMTFLATWPKTTAPKPPKTTPPPKPVVPVPPKLVVPVPPKPMVPVPAKPVATQKPSKSHPPKVVRPPKKPAPKPVKPTPRPTDQCETRSSCLASEYCWKSFLGICTYFFSWFQK